MFLSQRLLKSSGGSQARETFSKKFSMKRDVFFFKELVTSFQNVPIHITVVMVRATVGGRGFCLVKDEIENLFPVLPETGQRLPPEIFQVIQRATVRLGPNQLDEADSLSIKAVDVFLRRLGLGPGLKTLHRG